MNSEIIVDAEQRLGPRKEQEDRYAVFSLPGSPYTLAMLADGMGSSTYGAMAAEIGRNAVLDAFSEQVLAAFPLAPEQMAFACVVKAHNRVLAFSQSLRLGEDEISPGSTVLVAVIRNNGDVGICWSGDSMAAAWDGSALKVLTPPHNAQTDKLFKQVKPDASGNGLTRYLGEREYRFEPQIKRARWPKGMSLLLLTDGAFDAISSDRSIDQMRKQSAVRVLRGVEESELTDNASLIEVTFQPEEDGQCNCSEDTPSSRI